MKPIILIDCDGILANFIRGVCDEITYLSDNKQIPFTRLFEDDFKTWDILDTVGADAMTLLVDRINQPGWSDKLSPYPGARELCNELRGISSRLICVTSPWRSSDTWMRDRENWLVTRMGFDRKDVIFTSQKELVYGDYLIEDSHVNAESWADPDRQFRNGVGIILDRPWNAAYETIYTERVKSFDGIVELINRVEV